MKKYLNKIINGDSIEVLRKMPEESVDLIFADPPYNLQLEKELYRPNNSKVNGVTENWDKFNSFEAYDSFSTAWLTEAKKVLKKDGTMWVIGSYHNIFRVGKIIQDLGFWILNDIIWIKNNPMPNFRGTRFTNAHETILWVSKQKKSKYDFNYRSMKIFNDDKQMRSDWYIPICSGSERFLEDGKSIHSTQKPEALLYRIISSSSKPNDIVLDPFFGTGTTGAVAKRLNRNFIGIEKENRYVELAEKRIENNRMLNIKSLSVEKKTKIPRVPFGNLIEENIINPEEKLYSEDGSIQCNINSDASLELNDKIGSIHQMCKFITNKNSCNGWKFWFVKVNNKFVSIDKLRQNYLLDNYSIKRRYL